MAGGEVMTERPIIFDGESVRAILAGRETQTRRVVKPVPTGEPTPLRRICLACGKSKTGYAMPHGTDTCRACVRKGNEPEAAPMPKPTTKRLCAACDHERPRAQFERHGGTVAECCWHCTSDPDVRVTLQQLDAAAIVICRLRQIAAARLDGTDGLPTLGVEALRTLANEALEAVRRAR